MKKIILLALCLVLFSSCSALHMKVQVNKPDLKPNVNKSTLVVIRDTSFGFAIVFWNYLDGKLIGETKGKSYFITSVQPGTHYVMVASENTCSAKIDFKPGKVYYLREGVTMGWWRARSSGFSPVAPKDAEEAISNCEYWEYDKTGEDMEANLYQQAIKDYEEDVKNNPEGFKDMLKYQGN